MASSPVYIVDGLRTPFLKARGVPGPFSAADLAVMAGRELLSRQPFSPDRIDEVILGCVMPSEDEANIARLVALRLGCGQATPAWTVQRNCGSGMQSLHSAAKDIQLGHHDLVLAGGTEAMSRAPLLLPPAMQAWLSQFRRARRFPAKLRHLIRLRPAYFRPVIALLRGLRDPLCGLNMGQTAEILASQFQITRAVMDELALASHQRLADAQQRGSLSEVMSVYDGRGHFIDRDDGVRLDASLDGLARLRPVFDVPFGSVTAGNSSQVTDGAAMLLLASQRAVDQYQLPVLGRMVDVEWAALDPKVMGLGPVMAATALLHRNHYTLSDIDYWELNEAFAAQVLACLAAWASERFCQEQLGLTAPVGVLEHTRLNVDGGAIALGHPIGASGARIVLHLLHVLQRQHAQRGVAMLCIGGGQGGAALLEREE